MNFGLIIKKFDKNIDKNSIDLFRALETIYQNILHFSFSKFFLIIVIILLIILLLILYYTNTNYTSNYSDYICKGPSD